MNRNGAAAVVLAGGASRRMGTDKAWLELDGISLLERTLKLLTPLFETVLVSGKASIPLLEGYGAKWLPDLPAYGGKGPLAGIYTTLSVIPQDYLFVLACDMPWASAAVIQHMLQLAGKDQILVPYVHNQYQSLHALYHRGCLEVIGEMLQEGTYQVHRLFHRISPRIIGETELMLLDPELKSFENINTQEAYKRLLNSRPL